MKRFNLTYKLWTFLLVLLVGTTSCDMDSFLDVNQPEDDPVTTTPNFLLPGVEGMLSISFYQHTLRDSYTTQYRTTLWGTSSFHDKWDYRNPYRIGEWRRHYFDVGGNVNNLILRAEKDENYNYVAVGKTIMAYSTMLATDHFGDMPVYEAFQGVIDPHYDAQEEVYKYIENLLAEADVAYEKAGTAKDLPMGNGEDLIYGGDIRKWEGLNKALRAKMHLHLTAIQPDRYAKVLEAVSEAEQVGFEGALYRYDGSGTWSTSPMGPSKSRPQWDHVTNDLDTSLPTTFFMSKVKSASFEDPRLAKLMTAAANAGQGGVENFNGIIVSEGLGTASANDYPTLYGGHWTLDLSSQPLFLDEELQFIKAEAAFQTGDKSTAFAAYQEGIRLNLARLGVETSEVEDLMDSDLVAESVDALTLADIMEQKYVALYLAPESWTDMRRYNFDPTVFRGMTYPSQVLPEMHGDWFNRLPYDPETEYIYNLPEIERLGAKAEDWITKKMWWQK
ncbi:SusD/RagB family nutrient-binding outer membrane lipoprotein [Sediminitomix flava]|uniref:SusD-like starch-binding protein associating with outer membrane n=1 Tax=Sediminitomix flava TaxID=379075 RepID=A0A315ZFQ6_SEDFL|nr:SusD/RagB family nutrient-binding outer membrane lipoprotein [Sediminitomix flava]PWJ44405.1 SusD-like starch-binding protein associating with outer membrane [Sediminitomix flava]